MTCDELERLVLSYRDHGLKLRLTPFASLAEETPVAPLIDPVWP